MGNGIVKHLGYLFDCLLDVIYSNEDSCLICKENIEDDALICNRCLKNVILCEGFSEIMKDNISVKSYSLSYYSGKIKELILRLKYKSDFRCGEALGILMSNMIRREKIEFDIATFIPMTRSAEKVRGYNQSKYLASIIGKSIGKPVIDCLDKYKGTKDQIGLNEEMRWENLNGCFRVRKGIKLQNSRIILIDDVITSGATSFYCASELIKNGAKNVTVLTAAKSNV